MLYGAIVCNVIAIVCFLVAIVSSIRLQREVRRRNGSMRALRKGEDLGPEARRLYRMTNGALACGVLGLLGGIIFSS